MKNFACKKLLGVATILLLLILVVIAIFPVTVSAEENSSNNLANTTILTHGEIYGISVWSDTAEGTFEYNQNSMIENLRMNMNASVYIMSLSEQQLYLRKVDVVKSAYVLTTVSAISNRERNLIIFERVNNDNDFQNYYTEFSSAMSLLRSIMGEAQRFNLLGISGGGLVNMKYAVENPQIISQITSIATPYNGAALCSYDLAISKLNLYRLNEFIGSASNIEEIRKAWNSMETQPDFHTISIGTHISYLKEMLSKYKWIIDLFGKDFLEDLTTYEKVLDNAIVGAFIDDDKVEYICEQIIHASDRIDDNVGVDINSQNAYGYENATSSTIYFDKRDYDKFTSPASSYPFITPYISMGGNSKVIAEICKLVAPSTKMVTVSRPEGVYLENISMLFDLEWEVPSSVNNYKIEGIGSGLLSDRDTYVETIKIPSTIKYIEAGAFDNFDNLEQIIVEDGNQYFTSKDGVLYSKNMEELVYYPKNKSNSSYTIAEETRTIRQGAFYEANNLNQIDLSNVEYVEKDAFAGANISSITTHGNLMAVEGGVLKNTPYYEANNNIIWDDILLKYTSGEFPDSIKAVAEGAISGLALDVVEFNQDVIINSKAFANCTINEIIFNGDVTMGDAALYDCVIQDGISLLKNTVPQISNTSIYSTEKVAIMASVPVCDVLSESMLQEYYEVSALQINVSFESYNGESIDAIQYDYYGEIATLPEIEKQGYIFDGWYTEDDEKYSIGSIMMSSTDFSLYAVWIPIEYAISYDLQGGAFAEGTNVVYSYTIESEEINLPAPIRYGYHFVGWQSDGVDITNIPHGNSGSISLIATWEPETYNVKLNVGLENIEFNMSEITIMFGQSFTISEVPHAFGYKFLGWFDEQGQMVANERGEGFADVAGLDALYGKWEIENYELKIQCNDDSYVWVVNDATISGEQTLLQGEDIISFINLIDTFKRSEYGYLNGYKFIKFELAAGEDAMAIYGANASIEQMAEEGERIIYLTAVWEKEIHTFIFNTQIYGKTCPDIVMEYGAQYYLPTADELEEIGITKTGYHFAGWYTYTALSDGTIQYNDKMEDGLMPDLTVPLDLSNAQQRYNAQSDGGVTLIAKWEANIYTITFNSNGGNAIGNKTIAYDSEFGTLTTPSRRGYAFKNWKYQNNVIVASDVYTYTQDITLDAEWEIITYTITYVSSSYEAMDSSDTTYTVNDVVELGNAYKLGYKFEGWQDETGKKISVISKNTIGNKRLTATWSATQVNASSNGSTYNLSQAYTVVNVSANANFVIKNTVSQVMFTGSSQDEFKVSIDARNSALTLIFKNIEFSGRPNETMIDASNVAELNLIISGFVTLAAGQTNKDVTTAVIKAQNLNIFGDGTLVIKGASNIGRNGIHGLAGSPGIIASNGITFAIKSISVYGGNGASGAKPVTAADMVLVPPQQTSKGQPGIQGYQGNTGLTGGTGGNGAPAIQNGSSVINLAHLKDCYMRASSTVANAYLYGGNGGDGGEGGKGGKGGRGGMGRDGSLFVYGTAGGKGGTGGRGGNGGAGGIGSVAISSGVATNCTCTSGSNGLIGFKGEGGEGGEGGLGGEKMISGDRYPSGAKGDKGATGLSGRNR